MGTPQPRGRMAPVYPDATPSACWRSECLPLLPVARAAGPWLYGFDGRAYYDAISSWWTTLFGHRHPPIIAAIKEQLDTLDHVLLAGCTHAAAVELAERLRALTGGQLGHAFFASDGASATEIALKMAAHYARNRGFPCKTGFVCFAGGYHGETIGALGVTDVPLFRQAYEPLLRPATILPCPDARLGPPALERAVCALRSHLQAHAEEVAAVIVEPMVQCAGGMIMHSPEFLRCVRRLCDEYGVLLIFDEIAVGCGRTGRLFAHEHAGVRPDLLCLSKGITGGTLPLAVVLTTDEVFEAFLDERIERGFLHSHSYTGIPLPVVPLVPPWRSLKSLAYQKGWKRSARPSNALWHPLRRNMGLLTCAAAVPSWLSTYPRQRRIFHVAPP